MARTTAGLPISLASATRRADFLGRPVVGHAPDRVRLQERVAQRAQQIVGDAARVVAGDEHLVHAGERAGDVVVRRRFEDRDPLLERRAAERELHLLGVETAAADGQRLVEHRERVAHRARTPGGRCTSSASASASTPSRPSDVGEVARRSGRATAA